MNTGNNPLENFAGFDSMSTEEDLFSREIEVDDADPDNNDATDDAEDSDDGVDNTDDKGDKKPKPKSTTEPDLFAEFEEDDEDDEDEEDEDAGPEQDPIKSYFKEKGYYNEEEDKDLETDDLFDKAVESRVEETIGSLPEIAKQFNKFVIKGGNPEEFFKAVASDYNGVSITEDLDISKKDNQELVLRDMLAKEGNDQEEIDAQIGYLKDSGKLGSIATKKFEKWKTQKEEKAQSLAQQRIQEAQKEKQKLRENKQELSTYLQKNDRVGDIPFTPEDRTKLSTYMVDKSVKLKNGSTLTQFQKELYYDLPANQDAFIQLGVMMRNRNEDGTFNFKAIKEDIENNVSGKVKRNIRNSKGKSVKSSGTTKKAVQRKTLAEMFD